MKVIALLLAGFLAVNSVVADNDDPIVLIHGLAGVAELWMYAPELEESGLKTYAVNVGKFTSAWDRAVETYAQIKGTRVDYGVCHSRDFGHARFGEDFTGRGLFPEWDGNHPVHLMGHSYGAPTMRVLERLLREGSGCPEDTFELFEGGKDWLTSLTSLTGVLDGSTLVDILDDFNLLEIIKNLVIGLAGVLDNTIADQLYDIRFTQWGLDREPGESFASFWDRVVDSGFLSRENKDISVYDLSVEGVREFNNGGKLTYDDTYYFSFAAERTRRNRICFLFSCGPVHQAPQAGMTIFLWPSSTAMGNVPDPKHQENDGLVSWFAQTCPKKTDADFDLCKEYDGTWNKGEWTYMDINYLDHIQVTLRNPITDSLNYGRSARKLYIDHGRRLKALPSKASGRNLRKTPEDN